MVLAIDQYESVLAQLYDAVLDNAGWERALMNIGAFIDAPRSAFFLSAAAENLLQVTLQNGFPDEYLDSYNQYFSKIDPGWDILQKTPLGQWVTDQQIIAPDVRRNHPFYQEFLRPMAVSSAMASLLVADEDSICLAAFVREDGQPPFAHSELAVIQGLSRHIQRAARLYVRFSQLRSQADLGSKALEQLAWPLWVVNGTAMVKMSNRLAEPAGRKLPVTIQGGVLQAPGSLRDDLRRAIQQATQAGRVASGLRVPTWDDEAGAWQIVVLPLAPDSVFGGDWGGVPLALVVAQPLHAAVTPDLLLNRTYGLTAAECRLAALLTDGLAPSACAALLGVSIATVRTQLRRIYDKAGVRGLQGLQRVLSSLAALRCAPDMQTQ